MMTSDAELQGVIEEFIHAYNAGDVDSLLKVFSADYVDMSDGEPTLEGERACLDTAARLRDTFAKFKGNLAVQVDESEVFDNWAFDRGTLRVELQPKGTGDPVIVERRFLEIWRREMDGKWRVARAMDNSTTMNAKQSLDFRK